MARGWYGNREKHSLASRGIRVSESRDKYDGVMPYHKTIAGLKFTLKNSGKYTAKINMPIYLTEEEVMEMIYDEKIRREYDSINEIRIKDLKDFIFNRYSGAYELTYKDGSDLEKLEDDEEWQLMKRRINEQTIENKRIIDKARSSKDE